MKTRKKWNNASINVRILALHEIGQPVSLADLYFDILPTETRRKLIITTLKQLDMEIYKENIQCPYCSFEQSNLSYKDNNTKTMTCQKCFKEFKIEVKKCYKTCKIK